MTPGAAEPAGMLERAVHGGLLVLLLWLPLPWGSHRPWAADLLTLGASALLLAQLGLIASGRAGLPKNFGRLLAAPLLWWVVWLGWIGLQLAPLDGELLARWSPSAATLAADAAGILGVPAQNRISISAAAATDGLLLSTGYASLYLLVLLSCAGRERRSTSVLAAIVLASTIQAVYGGLMLLSGLEWGFLGEKTSYRGVATGTFVNRNHLANYMALGAAAALGMILSELGNGPRSGGARGRLLGMIRLVFSAKMRARLALVILVIALILTRSRMGNTAFFISLCICGMGFILLRQRRYIVPALLLFSSIVVIDILIVSNWYGLERVVDRIEQTDLVSENRTNLLTEARATIDAYAVTGSGLGTFALAHDPFRARNSGAYFDHAHNDYVQFLIETGVIGFAILAVFVAGHALHAVRILISRRSRHAAAAAFAALMAMLAEAIHATADFNLQIPANAATLLVLMSLSAGASETSRGRAGRSMTTGRRRRQDAVHSGRMPKDQAGSGETHGS